ncbi:MAG TPA: hypothetical protein VL048_10735 [Xanthobacteraceae bacterium]|nr:hypothetical protein [Xanthobacteraceae bacterium]
MQGRQHPQTVGAADPLEFAQRRLVVTADQNDASRVSEKLQLANDVDGIRPTEHEVEDQDIRRGAFDLQEELQRIGEMVCRQTERGKRLADESSNLDFVVKDKSGLWELWILELAHCASLIWFGLFSRLPV